MSRVLVLTDVHHGSDAQRVQGSAAWPLLERVLGIASAQSPDLLIDLGDRINESAEAEVERAMTDVAGAFTRLTVPRVHVQGNDDVMARPKQEALLGVPLGNHALELAGWQLVFLDTFDGSVEGVVTDGTLLWLERTLAASPLPAILFSHQPLDGEPLPGNVFFGGDYAHEAHPKGHEALRRVLSRSDRVRLAVAGHAHEARAVTVAGVLYVTLDALVPFTGEARTQANHAWLELTEGLAHLQTFGLTSQTFEVAG